MISDKEKSVLLKLKERILTLTDILDFRLFGSRVRKEYATDSDYDILVVVPSLSFELKRKIREIVWEVGYEHDMFISALIVNRKEWNESPLRLSPIKISIEKI